MRAVTIAAPALALLQQLTGRDDVTFREGQLEAITRLVEQHGRTLVVQRTGWGKSAVYFIATRLLRDAGAGPTVLISPLLALMRNQLEAAERAGVAAVTINSANQDDWPEIEDQIRAGEVDLLLISPERLQNERFRDDVLPQLIAELGMLVVDEAHCISDWGHDFRPDYRRIAQVLVELPPEVPVLCTTATANDRVIADVVAQLGDSLEVLRGPLERESLRLAVVELPAAADRLAWLATVVPDLPGSGIIYCLTIHDTRRVAEWLRTQGIDARAYSGDDDPAVRIGLEDALLRNELKALVATSALGMGFDKPDLGFVIHYQRPASVISYYQQVGRAGRALEKAYGILLSGNEDDEIAEYFIRSAFPKSSTFGELIALLERTEGASRDEIAERINASYREVDTALKILEVEGAIGVATEKKKRLYFRTPNPWQLDTQRITQITGQRRAEREQMREYVGHTGCLMQFLVAALDDRSTGPCGICANCQGKGFSAEVDPKLLPEAEGSIRVVERTIDPRLRWPTGLFPERAKLTILPEERNEPGRALCHYGDGGWGKRVRIGKYEQHEFSEELVDAAISLIRDRWKPNPPPEWVTAIPSPRRPKLVHAFAVRVAARLGLPFVPAFEANQVAEQKTMANSAMQSRNARAMLRVKPEAIRPGPVLLVDDMIDSGWTLTIAGWRLRTNGCRAVHPFALARSTPRDG